MKRLFAVFRQHYAILAVFLIIVLSMHVRLTDYHWPYLRNIDSYMFYRQMDEIIQNNGVYPSKDIYVRAPEGEERSLQLYPYQHLGAYSYMFFRMFFSDLKLWEFLIYFPAFIASLAALPMYYIGKMLYDKNAGMMAAFFFVFDTSIVSRTLGADPDSDAIVTLIPLIVVAVFLATYRYLETKKSLDKRGLLYTALTGIMLGVWTHTWVGYWYIVWIITGMLVLRILFDIIITRKLSTAWNNSRHHIISYAIYMSIMLFLFVLPFFGLPRVLYTFTGPIEFQSIKNEEGNPFPNVGVSVAELQGSGNLIDILQRSNVINASNPLSLVLSPFFLMIYSLIYLAYSSIEKRYKFDKLTTIALWIALPLFIVLISLRLTVVIALFFMVLFSLIVIFFSRFSNQQRFDSFLMLSIWFLGPMLATIVAVRFAILFSPAIAIGMAILFSKLINMSLAHINLGD